MERSGTPTLKKSVIDTLEKPFECVVCMDRSCTSLKCLVAHLLTHVYPYKCGTCDTRFFKNTDLEKHMSIRADDKPFKCDVWSKTFRLTRSHNGSRECNLKYHMRTQTGDKPFQCYECSKRFYENRALRVHMIMNTVDQRFQFDVCSKRFGNTPIHNLLIRYIN